MGGKLTYEWFSAGFENGVDNTRWQIKWKDDAFVQEWAKPQSTFWSTPVESACARNTTAPDRVVYMVFSWSVKAQSDWRMYLTQAITNFKSKYTNLRRIDLVNQIHGPNNMLCPTPPAANETIVISAELQAAMAEVATAFPGLVFISPKFEARSCADFQGGGPHLTSAGNMAAARLIAEYFAPMQ